MMIVHATALSKGITLSDGMAWRSIIVYEDDHLCVLVKWADALIGSTHLV